jgi:cell division septum initiation protein DivIVA
MNYEQVTPYHGVVIKHLLEEIQKLKEEIKELKNKVG